MSARVLIVDDSAFMRTVLRKMLEEEGFEIVAEAGNGLEAIKMAKEHQPQRTCKYEDVCHIEHKRIVDATTRHVQKIKNIAVYQAIQDICQRAPNE